MLKLRAEQGSDLELDRPRGKFRIISQLKSRTLKQSASVLCLATIATSTLQPRLGSGIWAWLWRCFATGDRSVNSWDFPVKDV